MPLPDHLRGDFSFTCLGCTAGFRLYWTLGAGSITVGNIEGLADSIMGAYTNPLQACLTTDTEIHSLKLRYTNGGSEFESESTDVGLAGEAPGESLPEHDAVVIRRKTGTTGRARRGRIFVPFVPEALTDGDGTVASAGNTAYLSLANLLDQNHVSAGTGITLVNVQPSPSLNILLPITRAEVVQQVCTRRDRQRERVRTSIVA